MIEPHEEYEINQTKYDQWYRSWSECVSSDDLVYIYENQFMEPLPEWMIEPMLQAIKSDGQSGADLLNKNMMEIVQKIVSEAFNDVLAGPQE